MKRSWVVNCLVSSVLGCAAGSFLNLAVSFSSIYYGILAVLAILAATLNIACGPDKKDK
ncbi:MAG: hypothetical protein IKF38_01805 [Clostridia bacterium]|nr:hypothetical protein [Clostridia bacterium]